MATAVVEEKDPLNLTDTEFGARLGELVKAHNNILKLAGKVYALKKNERLAFANGDIIGRKELRSMSSAFTKELRGLKKNYRAHGKRKRRRRREGGSAGFKNPIFVSDAMKNFFAVANLGSDPRPGFEGEAPLNTQLAVGAQGVTTRAIMTPLFNIYAHVNQMQKDPAHKQYLTATDQMNQFFAPTWQRLTAKDRAQDAGPNPRLTKPDKNGVRKPIPVFDPQHFQYNRVQSIVADNNIKKETLNAEQLAFLDNAATKRRLAEEQYKVSGILLFYRLRNASLSKIRADGKKIGIPVPDGYDRDQAYQYLVQQTSKPFVYVAPAPKK